MNAPIPGFPGNYFDADPGAALTEAERALHDALMDELAAPLADTTLLAAALSDGDADTTGLTGDLRASAQVTPTGAIVQEARA
jgi:hypothetical protein